MSIPVRLVPLNDEDLRLLVLMANEASRVLENMWMVQQLAQKSRSITKSCFIESGYFRYPKI